MASERWRRRRQLPCLICPTLRVYQLLEGFCQIQRIIVVFVLESEEGAEEREIGVIVRRAREEVLFQQLKEIPRSRSGGRIGVRTDLARSQGNRDYLSPPPPPLSRRSFSSFPHRS